MIYSLDVSSEDFFFKASSLGKLQRYSNSLFLRQGNTTCVIRKTPYITCIITFYHNYIIISYVLTAGTISWRLYTHYRKQQKFGVKKMHLTRRPNMTIYSYNFLQLAFKSWPWTPTTSFSITEESKTKFPCAEISTKTLVLIPSISGDRGNTPGRCLNPVPTLFHSQMLHSYALQ